jgi:hypothetical protein
MRLTGQVLPDLRRAAERGLGVNNPLGTPSPATQGFEGSLIRQAGKRNKARLIELTRPDAAA